MLGLGDIRQIDCVRQRGDVMLTMIQQIKYPKPIKEAAVYIHWQHLTQTAKLKDYAAWCSELMKLRPAIDLMLKITPFHQDGMMILDEVDIKVILDIIESAGFKRHWFNKVEINEPFNEKGITNTSVVEADAIKICRALQKAKPDRWQFVLSAEHRGGWQIFNRTFSEELWDWRFYDVPNKPERLLLDKAYFWNAKFGEAGNGITCSECNMLMPNDTDWSRYFTQKNMFALASVMMDAYYATGETAIYPLWSNQWGVFSAISDNPIIKLLTQGMKAFIQYVKTLPEE